MIYFAIYLCVMNLIVALLASWYRDRVRRLTYERDLSREYAAGLEEKFNSLLEQLHHAQQQLKTRLVLHGHEANPEHQWS